MQRGHAMSALHRRDFLRMLGGVGALSLLPPSIQKALAIPANSVTGTLMDVAHVVILMQENRSFDHYFGTLKGVRGYGDRFPIPLASGKPVWYQQTRQQPTVGAPSVPTTPAPPNTPGTITPYHLDSSKGNAQRVTGTPHGWLDTHYAWFDGRTGFWPGWKEVQSMGYYKEAELPFQFALANAFTLCDAYHAGTLSSTNTNRLVLFTGTNNPTGMGGGPAIDNTNDHLGPSTSGYSWTTYPERLQAAGVSWQVYQDETDNFTDNSLEGFNTFRRAVENRASAPNDPLLLRGVQSKLSNNSLAGFKADCLAGTLPSVSYIVGPAAYSEHTGPSSPVQGAWYTQQVIEALTADPAVWAKTVLIVNFDENDGFFDHIPPPCAPSINPDGSVAGAATMDVTSERRTVNHQVYDQNWVYGPGVRVPCYVISPFSRGGWVNSQVFDHTSVVQFLEQRFGVAEPNISAYRRAICGNLLSCFNFANPNNETFPALPSQTQAQADALRTQQEALAQLPDNGVVLPVQNTGVRPSRALPYELHITSRTVASGLQLGFHNTGQQGVVFHVYDTSNLASIPRRYAVEACKSLSDTWASAGSYDLFVLGPNGFHRRLSASAPAAPTAGNAEVDLCYDAANGDVLFSLANTGMAAQSYTIRPNAYFPTSASQTVTVTAGQVLEVPWVLSDSSGWYDFTVTAPSPTGFSRRFAGRVETGRHSISDPAMGM